MVVNDKARANRLRDEAERIAESLVGRNERQINDELAGWRERSPEMCRMIEEILRAIRGEE